MEFDLTKCNELLDEFARVVRNKTFNPYVGKLKCGVDLGTANIVLSVVDEQNRPIAGAMHNSTVVRDGIVVDYIGACKAVEILKCQVEQMLGVTLQTAATAIPPGIIDGNVKVIANVVEAAGFQVTNIIDEPTAAATVIGLKDGAVVDVGGGTTGISILKDGKVIYTNDEATGGTHMTLVLAGFNKSTIEEAESLKKDHFQEKDIFPVVKPVVEKMASIIKNYIDGFDVKQIYVVGGACCFSDFEKVFEKFIGIPTVKPIEPLLVTPLGIAMNSII
ncbi:ethanolamine utilization protein EutJ [Anaerovorax sp. IOR16]|uniref:ethanolamine utilization protein EutJ n=1 Tax=Anaerovorax sp. IOR16 TaxID=2773458 RepID=UPI0019D18C91